MSKCETPGQAFLRAVRAECQLDEARHLLNAVESVIWAMYGDNAEKTVFGNIKPVTIKKWQNQLREARDYRCKPSEAERVVAAIITGTK